MVQNLLEEANKSDFTIFLWHFLYFPWQFQVIPDFLKLPDISQYSLTIATLNSEEGVASLYGCFSFWHKINMPHFHPVLSPFLDLRLRKEVSQRDLIAIQPGKFSLTITHLSSRIWKIHWKNQQKIPEIFSTKLTLMIEYWNK